MTSKVGSQINFGHALNPLGIKEGAEDRASSVAEQALGDATKKISYTPSSPSTPSTDCSVSSVVPKVQVLKKTTYDTTDNMKKCETIANILFPPTGFSKDLEMQITQAPQMTPELKEEIKNSIEEFVGDFNCEALESASKLLAQKGFRELALQVALEVIAMHKYPNSRLASRCTKAIDAIGVVFLDKGLFKEVAEMVKALDGKGPFVKKVYQSPKMTEEFNVAFGEILDEKAAFLMWDDLVSLAKEFKDKAPQIANIIKNAHLEGNCSFHYVKDILLELLDGGFSFTELYQSIIEPYKEVRNNRHILEPIAKKLLELNPIDFKGVVEIAKIMHSKGALVSVKDQLKAAGHKRAAFEVDMRIRYLEKKFYSDEDAIRNRIEDAVSEDELLEIAKKTIDKRQFHLAAKVALEILSSHFNRDKRFNQAGYFIIEDIALDLLKKRRFKELMEIAEELQKKIKCTDDYFVKVSFSLILKKIAVWFIENRRPSMAVKLSKNATLWALLEIKKELQEAGYEKHSSEIDGAFEVIAITDHHYYKESQLKRIVISSKRSIQESVSNETSRLVITGDLVNEYKKAGFAPFIIEELNRGFEQGESIHLVSKEIARQVVNSKDSALIKDTVRVAQNCKFRFLSDYILIALVNTNRISLSKEVCKIIAEEEFLERLMNRVLSVTGQKSSKIETSELIRLHKFYMPSLALKIAEGAIKQKKLHIAENLLSALEDAGYSDAAQKIQEMLIQNSIDPDLESEYSESNDIAQMCRNFRAYLEGQTASSCSSDDDVRSNLTGKSID